MDLPTKYTNIHVNIRPEKEMNIEFNQPDSTFKLVEHQLRDLKPGELLVKNLYFSNDPAQRPWIQKGNSGHSMYTEPIVEGSPMKSISVCKVIQSNDKKYQPGITISCQSYWGDYAIIKSSLVYTKTLDFLGFQLPDYLGLLGTTGLAAYFGLFDVAQLKKGQIIVVSGAAGATGAVTVQIAKNIIRARKVIGIAGGEAKCEYVKSIGADSCVDYKSPTFVDDMKKALDGDECDVYWDGVGGEILDRMMVFTKRHGTIVSCGSIAGYNDKSKSVVKSWGLITVKRLTVKGFILADFLPKVFAAIIYMYWYTYRGYIKNDSTANHIVDLSDDPEALYKVPKIFNQLFNGEKPPGKLITKLSDP